MIVACTMYRAAFKEYAEVDATYKWQPEDEEWALYEKIQPILKSFAEVTTVLSGSTYPTANIFYPYIMNVKIAIVEHAMGSNANLKKMGEAMLDKFDKYWDSNGEGEGNENNGKNEKRKRTMSWSLPPFLILGLR